MRMGLVINSEDCLYSSNRNYAGPESLVDLFFLTFVGKRIRFVTYRHGLY